MPRNVKLTETLKDKIHSLRKQGLSQPAIAERLGLSQWAVSTTLRETIRVCRKEYEDLIEIKYKYDHLMRKEI